MMNTVMITRLRGAVVAALSDGDRILSIDLCREDDKPAVNDIYLGRVRDIRRPMGAAFVELSDGQMGYLNLNDSSFHEEEITGGRKLRPGDEFPVQITKEGVGEKDPALSASLTIPGRLIVATEKKGMVSISSRITEEKARKSLKHLLAPLALDCGFIVRTNCLGVDESTIFAEAEKQAAVLARIKRDSAYRTAHSLLYRPWPEWMELVRDLPADEPAKVVTDIPAYAQMLEESLPEGHELQFYDDSSVSLATVYRLENCLDRVTQRKVWLDSGAFIVIDQTEALVAVDVNFGKSTAKKDEERSSLAVNCEAAVEIARQIRLRNLAGIILVDFINMKKEESYAQLRSVIEQACAADPCRMLFVDFTTLGLGEFTRKKRRLPVVDQMIKMK